MKQQQETPNPHYLDGRHQAAVRLQKIRNDVTRLSPEDRQILRSGWVILTLPRSVIRESAASLIARRRMYKRTKGGTLPSTSSSG